MNSPTNHLSIYKNVLIDYTPHLTGPGNGPDSSQEEAENIDWEKYYATPDEWQKMKINPTDPHMPRLSNRFAAGLHLLSYWRQQKPSKSGLK